MPGNITIDETSALSRSWRAFNGNVYRHCCKRNHCASNGIPTVTRDPAGSFPGPDNDTINGGGGDDTIDGGGGNDTIAGDPGNDTITGGDGDDTIIWRNGDGSDGVTGGNGIDTQQLIMSDAAGDTATLSTIA